MKNTIKAVLKDFMIFSIIFGMLFNTTTAQNICEFIKENCIAYAAVDGGFDHSNPISSISGIMGSDAYDKPPIKISLYRNPKVALDSENGFDKMYDSLAGSWLSYNGPDSIIDASTFYITNMNQGTYNKYFGNGNPTYELTYDTSNGNIVRKNSNPSLLRVDTCSKPANGVYFDIIKGMSKEDLVNSWASIATDKAKSVTAWGYITSAKVENGSTSYNINKRIGEVFNPNNYNYGETASWDEGTKTDAWYRYLDMLLSLYTVVDGNQKDPWREAITDYITANNLQSSPISVAVEQAVAMTFDGRAYFGIISTIDYLQYATQVDTLHSMNHEARFDGSKGNMYNMILDSANASIKATPGWNAKRAMLSGSIVKSDGFSWGLSAITKSRIWTNKTSAYYKGTGVTTAYIETMGISNSAGNKQYGYSIWPMPVPISTFEFGSLSATPDNHTLETPRIDTNVTLTLDAGIDKDEVGVWISLIDKAKNANQNFTITVNWTRDSTNLNNKTPQIISNPTVLVWTPAEMLEWISGRKSIVAFDNISNTELIGSKPINEVMYTANIKVQIMNQEMNSTVTDPATFIQRLLRIGYTSTPQAYTEFKNYGVNSNMSGNLSEDFEAMAGVPSTEQMYFAAGGSEFIVDVTLNEVNDEVAKRTYDYYYTSTDCEYKKSDACTEGFTVPSYSGSLLTGSDYSLNVHNGDLTVKVTISGAIKNDATPVTVTGKGDVSATCPAKPNSGDLAARSAAYSALTTWYNKVSAYTISHTAASDGVRSTSIGAVGSGSLPSCPSNVPQTTQASDSKWHTESKSDGNGGTTTIKVADPASATASPSGPASWSVTATWTIPKCVICGPCCEHVLPEIHDSWTQTTRYDSMEINDVHIWRIDQGAIEGLTEILNVDVVGASIVKGTPNIFYNIALKNDANYKLENHADSRGIGHATNTATVGRMHYSFEQENVDIVEHNLGSRTNKCDGLAITVPSNIRQNGGGGHNQAYAYGLIYAFSNGAYNSGTNYNTSHTGNTMAMAGETQAKEDPRTVATYGTQGRNYAQVKMDARDRASVEGNYFINVRENTNVSTMITDFLILQTSSGDQSVMYYQQSAPTNVKLDQQMGHIEIAPALGPQGGAAQGGGIANRCWYGNGLSAANWSKTQIGLGSYTGKYWTGTSKFNGTAGGGSVKTIFDNHLAKTKVMVRPAKQRKLMIYAGALNIKLSNTNKAYYTGYSEVFWSNQLHWNNKAYTRQDSLGNTIRPYASITRATDTAPYKTDVKTFKNKYNFVAKTQHQFGAGDYISDGGVTLEAFYADTFKKCNDIIVHDPVSTQDTALVSLPEYRDQRTGKVVGTSDDVTDMLDKSNVCPGEPGLCNYRELDCKYIKDVLVLDSDFDTQDKSGNFINKVTGNGLKTTVGFSLDKNNSLDGTALRCFGTRLSIPFSELGISYNTSTHLKVEADVIITPNGTEQMIFSFNEYDLYLPARDEYGKHGNTNLTLNTGNGWERKINIPIADGKKHHLTVDFAMSGVKNCKVYIDGVESTYTTINTSRTVDSTSIGNSLNIGSWGKNDIYGAAFWLDNLKITRMAGTSSHTEECYTKLITHPDGLNAHRHTADCLADKISKKEYIFGYNGNVQAFTVPANGYYKIEAWGASGGGIQDNSKSSHAGQGGYTAGEVYLEKGTTLYVYVGGEGVYGTNPSGGWNGGGTINPGSSSGSGGGASDVRLVGGAWSNSQGLKSRILVAGGGGGCDNSYDGASVGTGDDGSGGAGGGITGENARKGGVYSYGTGGTQTSGSALGYGAGCSCNTDTGGGGGGWYGGLATHHNNGGGGGGSSFVTGYSGCDTTYRDQQGKYTFKNVVMQQGGNYGNGKVKITRMSTIIDEIQDGINTGSMSEAELREYLGSAYEYVISSGTITTLYTYADWKTSNRGFYDLVSNNITTNTDGSFTIQSKSGWECGLDTEIDGSALRNIEIIYKAGSSLNTSTGIGVNNATSTYYGTYKTNENGDIVCTIDIGSNLKGVQVKNIWFDLGSGAASGIVTVKQINFKGYGISSTKIIAKTVSSSYRPGEYSYKTNAFGSINYNITVEGAGGGDARNSNAATIAANSGGAGASINTDKVFSPNTALTFTVGGKGKNQASTQQIGGNISTQTTEKVSGTVDYNYNGGVQSFTAPGTGIYSITAYGASGGADTVSGGQGGTSTGNVSLTQGQTIYICVGGAGASGVSGSGGGYNGGGNAGREGTSGAGGGATSITSVNRGTLSNFASHQDEIYMVAGGGGGAGNSFGDRKGGAGGGSGEVPSGAPGGNYAFGQGQHRSGGNNDGGGGGGGFYGGYASSGDGGGAGGSGWVGGVSNGNTYNGGRNGNGYVRITYTNVAKVTGTTVVNPQTTRVGDDGLGGYNGGGNGGIEYGENIPESGAGGGGATDLRIDGKGLANRVLVAGGGGGASSGIPSSISYGGNGGTPNGQSRNSYKAGGTATSGYALGVGQNGSDGSTGTSLNYGAIGGGGGGYYGGKVVKNMDNSGCAGGAGGSSYVAPGYNGVTYSTTNHSDGKYALVEYRENLVITNTNFTGTFIETLMKYYTLIPDNLNDGTPNPIWENCTKIKNYHDCNTHCIETKMLTCTEPHHKGLHYDVSNEICWSACNNDANHKIKQNEIRADITFTPGNFINLDYGFSIYFPNRGKFDDGQAYAIGGLTPQRGKGYTDTYSTSAPYGKGTNNCASYTGHKVGMNTTKWTRVKRIKFDIDVIYDDVLYLANEWIYLGDRGTYRGQIGGITNSSKYDEKKWSNYGTKLYDGIYKEYYDFYCVLENSEAKSASYTVEVTALNASNFNSSGDGQRNDNSEITNRRRESTYTALHGGTNSFNYDVVGRIGNFIMEDVEDFRFSNLFKEAVDKSDSTNKTEIKTYTTSSGLSMSDSNSSTNKATRSGQYIMTNETGAFACVNYKADNKYYKITVEGKGLNAGRLAVINNTDGIAANPDTGSETVQKLDTIPDDKFTLISSSSTKVSYYLDLSKYVGINNVDIKFIAKASNVMAIQSITVTKLGESPDSWLLDGIVREVDDTKQNIYLSWIADIRGIKVSEKTKWLDTWGTLGWMTGNRLDLPLSPDKNNIDVLKDEPMLTGYSAYMDIQTAGNYWRNETGRLQIIPKYYAIDLTKDKGAYTLTQLDVYMKHDGEYEPINIYNNVNKTSDKIYTKDIYKNTINLDWLAEKDRRNVSAEEERKTQLIYTNSLLPNLNGFTPDVNAGDVADNIDWYRPVDIPGGHVNSIGTNQYLVLDGNARTFVGGESTYADLKNIGNRVASYMWYRQAQRWHFSIGLPSSSVFVEHGKAVTTDNIIEVTDGNYIIICALNIVAVGDIYALRYTQQSSKSIQDLESGKPIDIKDVYEGSVTVTDANGTKHIIDLNEYGDELDYDPIVFVYNPAANSGQDVEIIGTH